MLWDGGWWYAGNYRTDTVPKTQLKLELSYDPVNTVNKLGVDMEKV